MTDPRWIPDASSVATFRANPEAFRLRYRQHLVPTGWQEAPGAGHAMHAAFKAWFSRPTSDVEGAIAALHAAWNGPPALFDTGGRSLGLCEATFRAYADHYPRETDPFEVLETESYFETTIARAGVSFPWCGRRDLVVRWDGERVIGDLKTTSAWFHTAKTEGFFLRFETAEQMLGYLAADQALDGDADRYYIDAVRLDPNYALKPDRDLRRWRCPGVVQPWRLDRWALDIAWTLDQIARLDAERGPDTPWPLYTDWGRVKTKPDEYAADFYWQPPELHAAARGGYERAPWSPKEEG